MPEQTQGNTKPAHWFDRNRIVSNLRITVAGTLIAAAMVSAIASFQPAAPNTRLTNDNGANGGYVSDYTLATGNPYTDATLHECSISGGRQNEPAIAVDPRNTSVLLGSSNDYCGVYNRGIPAGAVGPIWLGYYRSENGGASFKSSLVPGYPDDTSPYAQLSQARTASAGDPVIAWDAHGRAFYGSESSDDPAGSAKTVRRRICRPLPEPRRPGCGRHDEGRSRVLRHNGCGARLVGAEPAWPLQRQDG